MKKMRAKTKHNIFYAILLAILVLFFGYKIIMRVKENNERLGGIPTGKGCLERGNRWFDRERQIPE